MYRFEVDVGATYEVERISAASLVECGQVAHVLPRLIADPRALARDKLGIGEKIARWIMRGVIPQHDVFRITFVKGYFIGKPIPAKMTLHRARTPVLRRALALEKRLAHGRICVQAVLVEDLAHNLLR